MHLFDGNAAGMEALRVDSYREAVWLVLVNDDCADTLHQIVDWTLDSTGWRRLGGPRLERLTDEVEDTVVVEDAIHASPSTHNGFIKHSVPTVLGNGIILRVIGRNQRSRDASWFGAV